MGYERLSAEFGTYSEWLSEAILALDLDEPIPPACRGTGNPALFELMRSALGVHASTRFLDVGCGIGGPGRWLERATGCEVVGIDVMEDSVRGLRRLWPDADVLASSCSALPFADRSFDGAWALGVLETVEDKSATLNEVARVVRPGGSLGLYSFTTEQEVEAPRADAFESSDSLAQRLGAAGWTLVEYRLVNDLPSAPPVWIEQAKAVKAEIARRHAGDEIYPDIAGELEKIGRLCSSGQVEPWVFIARKE